MNYIEYEELCNRRAQRRDELNAALALFLDDAAENEHALRDAVSNYTFAWVRVKEAKKQFARSKSK